jgi:hypothetical protein
MKLPSVVKLSGPFRSWRTPAVCSFGTRRNADSMSGSNCSKFESSSENWKPSGMPSSAQGRGLRS